MKKRLIILAVIVLLLATATGGIYYWNYHYQFQEYFVSWEVNLTSEEEGVERSSPKYINFGKNVLKYTKDGASYIDNKGKTIWVQTYEMKAPIAVVNGSFRSHSRPAGQQHLYF